MVRLWRQAGLEEPLDILDRPVADACLRVGGDVRCVLPIRSANVAGEGHAGFDRPQRIAWRMALFAMGNGVDKIVSAIPFIALGGLDLDRTGGEEQSAPANEKRAPAGGEVRPLRLVGDGRRTG